MVEYKYVSFLYGSTKVGLRLYTVLEGFLYGSTRILKRLRFRFDEGPGTPITTLNDLGETFSFED